MKKTNLHIAISFLQLFVINAAILLMPTFTYAQREVQMVQYLANPMAINPAYAGAREVFHLNASIRRQWIPNVPGLPTSQTIALDGAVGKAKNIGIGLQAVNDRTSGFGNTGLVSDLAYHYALSEDQKISIGLQAGFNVLPVVDFNSRQSVNTAIVSYGWGIRYEDPNFWVGAAMPEMANKSFSGGSASQFSSVAYSRPLLLNAGVKVSINDDLLLRPSLLVAKQSGRKLSLDLNAEAVYRQKITAGMAYRQLGVNGTGYLHALAGYQVSQNVLVGGTYSTIVPEAWGGNGRGVFEVLFTFIPNPKK